MFSQHLNRDGGVSPVIAVILMVAVTVTLSAVIGGFALNLGQSTTSNSQQSDLGVSTEQSDGQFTATVVTGSADKVTLLVNGTAVDNVTNATPGDTLSTSNISQGSELTIVSTSDGESSVVSSETASSDSQTSQTVEVTQTTFNDSFDDGTYTDNWTVLKGTWSESYGNLTDESSTNNDLIIRNSSSAYGNWVFTHNHGSKYYGAQAYFISNDEDGNRSTIESGYYIGLRNSNSNYERVLRKINSSGAYTLASLGNYDGATHTYNITRYTNGSFVVRVDGSKKATVTDNEIQSSEYVGLKADDVNHRWYDFSIEKVE